MKKQFFFLMYVLITGALHSQRFPIGVPESLPPVPLYFEMRTDNDLYTWSRSSIPLYPMASFTYESGLFVFRLELEMWLKGDSLPVLSSSCFTRSTAFSQFHYKEKKTVMQKCIFIDDCFGSRRSIPRESKPNPTRNLLGGLPAKYEEIPDTDISRQYFMYPNQVSRKLVYNNGKYVTVMN